MANGTSFPTILVAENDDALRSAVVRDLQHLGYFVLIAQDSSDALEIVRVHSRPIQLLLTHESIDGRTLAATLKQYRPSMRVLFITRRPNVEGVEALESEIAKVRELLQPPVNPGGEFMANRRPSRTRVAGGA